MEAARIGRTRGRAALAGESTSWLRSRIWVVLSLVRSLVTPVLSGVLIAALALLILETQNDYVRFHGTCSPPGLDYTQAVLRTAYQSALLTTPLLALLLLTNLLIPFPHFLRLIFLLASIGVTVFTSFRAWKDAQEGLSRFWLPVIGEMAERWVSEE